MSIKIAINGFGRIGRNTFKAGFGLKGVEFVAVNDLTDTKTLAHLLKHDSVYGLYKESVKYDKTSLIIGDKKVKVLAEREPVKLPWKKLGIDVVLECTGIFRTKELASAHLKAGAKRVIISAPAKSGGINTYIPGVNDDKYNGEEIVDMGSCTTNCIAPVMKVLEDAFGIKKALMTTIHSYTADQRLVDAPHKDLRRGRSAAINIVPTTTGAAVATTKVIPKIKGCFDGISIRVPIPIVSLSDIIVLLKKKVTVAKVNQAFERASKTKALKNILAVSDEELVSSDFLENPYSSIVDLPLTKVINGNLAKVIAWYDNEWGYSSRLAEFILTVGKSIK